jgi:hypothetical protein
LYAVEYQPNHPPQLDGYRVRLRGFISHQERARAALDALVRRFSLTDEEANQLVTVLGRKSFSTTLAELDKLLSGGYQVDAIMSGHAIRVVFRNNERFGSRCVFRGRSGPVFESKTSCPTWKRAVTWASGLGLITDEDELEMFFVHCYDKWLSHPRYWKRIKSFEQFVGRSIQEARREVDVLPTDFMLWDEGDNDDPGDADSERRLYRVLARDGLVPDIWTDPFDERVSIDPTFPLLEDYWPKSEMKNDNDDE